VPGDGRRPGARRRFVDLIRDADRVGPKHVITVPYPGWPLPAYRFAMPDEATVVLGATLMSASTIVMALNARLVRRMRPRPPAVVPGAVQCARAA